MAVEQEMKRTRVRKLERGKKDEKEQMTWPPSRLNFIPLKWSGSGEGWRGSGGDSKVEANEKLRTVKVKLLCSSCRVSA